MKSSIIRRYTFWDWLAWIAFAYIILYLLLRVLGVLHSPPIADILGIASLGYFAGKYAKEIDIIRKEIDIVNLKLENVGDGLEKHIENKNVHR